MKITKSKNNITANKLVQRLTRLERILQQLLESSGNNLQNSRQGGGAQNTPFADLPVFAIKDTKINDINQSITSEIRGNNTAKNNSKTLLLSQSQIIVELALAIARANRRNS